MPSSNDRWLACIAAALGVTGCAREPQSAAPQVAAKEVPAATTTTTSTPTSTPTTTPTSAATATTTATAIATATATPDASAHTCKPGRGSTPYPLICGRPDPPDPGVPGNCGPKNPNPDEIGPPVRVTLSPIVGADMLDDIFNFQSYVAFYTCRAFRDATAKAGKKLRGTVVLDLTIASNGDVTRAVATGKGLPDSLLRAIESVAKTSFPVCDPSASGSVVVRVPMALDPR